MSVDLPAPFSPINPSTSPGLISRLFCVKAGTPAKDFSTRFSLSSGVDTAGGVISIVFQFGDETIAIRTWAVDGKFFPVTFSNVLEEGAPFSCERLKQRLT